MIAHVETTYKVSKDSNGNYCSNISFVIIVNGCVFCVTSDANLAYGIASIFNLIAEDEENIKFDNLLNLLNAEFDRYIEFLNEEQRKLFKHMIEIERKRQEAQVQASYNEAIQPE